MSAQPEPSPERHLHIIDGATGEALDECPGCRARDDVVKGLERDIRGWASRYAELKRDKEAEAKRDPLWPDALRLFKLWRRLCVHPRAGWDADRFEQVRPYLKKHGLGVCERAIVGAAFDAFETVRKNGSKKRHDGWELIFRNADKFEEFANRAPLDFVSELEAEDEARVVAAREA